MSYPIDLDDYAEGVLLLELIRRHKARSSGVCDYCNRPHGQEPACKYPHRHRGEATNSAEQVGAWIRRTYPPRFD